MTVDTDVFITRCSQKTGIGISLDIPARTGFSDVVIPLVKGMTGRARQVADLDLLKMIVEYLDIACALIVEREDIIDQFSFWMGRHSGYFILRHPAL